MAHKPHRLCTVLGHAWRSTTVPDVRVCARAGCQAAERWDGARWVAVARVVGAAPAGAKPARTLWE